MKLKIKVFSTINWSRLKILKKIKTFNCFTRSGNQRCLNLNLMKSKLTIPQFPNLDLAENLFEWSVLSAHKKWRQMWNINPAFMLGSLVLHSSVLAVWFALVFHAVWRHSKKQNTSAPIAMPWLELLSHNSKLFTVFSDRNNE